MVGIQGTIIGILFVFRTRTKAVDGEEIRKQTKILYIYFNNHYGGKAVVNALQFRARVGNSLSETETNALEHARTCLSNLT